MTENEVVQKLEQVDKTVRSLVQERTALKEENEALKRKIKELEDNSNIEGPWIPDEFQRIDFRKLIPISALEFSEKTKMALEAAKIKTVEDILKRSGKILKIRNIGRTSANEIYDRICLLGFENEFSID
ncbi:MAG: hypothetical protein IKF52_06520 [Clostridia bacterium]|nr:hypothetical protein [Clostridia bacterium]